MADDEALEPVFTFLFASFGFTLAVFPLVATIESTVFGGSLGELVVLGTSVVLSIPAALEFVFSERNPRLVGRFVGVFVVLYFIVLVGQAGVYVALGASRTVPVAEFAALFATYVVAYWLIYRGGLGRLRGVLTR